MCMCTCVLFVAGFIVSHRDKPGCELLVQKERNILRLEIGFGAKYSPVVGWSGGCAGAPFQAVGEYLKHLKVDPGATEWYLNHLTRAVFVRPFVSSLAK